jgi:hypothetical protein
VAHRVTSLLRSNSAAFGAKPTWKLTDQNLWVHALGRRRAVFKARGDRLRDVETAEQKNGIAIRENTIANSAAIMFSTPLIGCLVLLANQTNNGGHG